MQAFTLNFIDHVAIRASDMERSAAWYEKVLGMKRCNLPEWKPYPIFMLSGKAGIAIFPATDETGNTNNKGTRIDHFAFNVSRDGLEHAKQHFTDNGIEVKFQDHFYSHSIYIKDPDGHVVELTAIIDEESLYKG